MKFRIIIAGMLTLCVSFCAVFLAGCREVKEEQISRGLFSWKSDVFEDGGAELFSFMRQYGFTELYQSFSNSLDDSAASVFLINAEKENIDVYFLTGDPSWANNAGGDKQLEMIETASQMSKLASESGIKGIVFDIEPYLLKDWNENSKSIIEAFASGMKKAYSAAANQGFELILCIPYHYDDNELKYEMQTLIRSGCDRIAVMNYNRGREIASIENEVRYAQTYGKGIINIYEFKPPGEHGLLEKNTYYSEGFDAAILNFGGLAEAYPDSGVIMAAHDYEAPKDVIKPHG